MRAWAPALLLAVILLACQAKPHLNDDFDDSVIVNDKKEFDRNNKQNNEHKHYKTRTCYYNRPNNDRQSERHEASRGSSTPISFPIMITSRYSRMKKGSKSEKDIASHQNQTPISNTENIENKYHTNKQIDFYNTDMEYNMNYNTKYQTNQKYLDSSRDSSNQYSSIYGNADDSNTVSAMKKYISKPKRWRIHIHFYDSDLQTPSKINTDESNHECGRKNRGRKIIARKRKEHISSAGRKTSFHNESSSSKSSDGILQETINDHNNIHHRKILKTNFNGTDNIDNKVKESSDSKDSGNVQQQFLNDHYNIHHQNEQEILRPSFRTVFDDRDPMVFETHNSTDSPNQSKEGSRNYNITKGESSNINTLSSGNDVEISGSVDNSSKSSISESSVNHSSTLSKVNDIDRGGSVYNSSKCICNDFISPSRGDIGSEETRTVCSCSEDIGSANIDSEGSGSGDIDYEGSGSRDINHEGSGGGYIGS